MFRLRALSFIFGFPLMLWICYAGGWWLLGAVLILAFIALREWSRAISLTAARPNYPLSALFILAFLFSVQFLPGSEVDYFLVFLIAAAVGLAFISRILLGGGPSALADIGAALLTPLYLGFFFSFLLRLRLEPWAAPTARIADIPLLPGVYFLIILFLTCWIMDTGAFLCGRFIGGAKLCPSISPGKTMTGFFGALITAALAAAGGFALVGLRPLDGLLLGALMGVAGQLGDLGKSLIKREAGLKDFGLVFPGHGGVLDRFDNILFNAPLMFYFLIIWGQ
jgi:phosphatidate cytidylyltransferase